MAARHLAAVLLSSIFCLSFVAAGSPQAAAAEGPAKEPTFHIPATLVGPDGKAVALDCRFAVYEKRGEMSYGTPGRVLGGVFTISMPPGKYEMAFPNLRDLGYYFKGPAAIEIKAAGPNPAMQFVVDRLVPLEITVNDAETRKPVSGVDTSAQFDNMGLQGFTNEEGLVRFMVEPGTVKIEGGKGDSGVTAQTVKVDAEGAKATVVLAPRAKLEGKVVAADGKPVKNVWANVWIKYEDGEVDTTHSVRTSGATFTDFGVPTGPCIVVVGAEGLAPKVEPLYFVGSVQKTYTLSEGVEVTFKADIDPAILAPSAPGQRPPRLGVAVMDANTGVPIVSFPLLSNEPEKKSVPIAERKMQLLPGKYKVVCSDTQLHRLFIVEEMDLKEARTVKVSVGKATRFDIDVEDLMKGIRFPSKP